jgi:hypothetical protein
VTVAATYLAQDPLLPARDHLMNPDHFAEQVTSTLGGAGIERCERVKAKYRIGESLRVLYRLRIAGEWHVVAARMFAPGRAAEVYRRTLQTAVPVGRLRPVGYDAALETVFWTFPNDRKIAHLSALSRPIRFGHLGLDARWTTSRVVAYAPERAATAECLDPDGAVLGYAKVYSGDDGARSLLIHRDLLDGLPADDPDLLLPAALAYSAEHRMLIVEPVPGGQFAALGPAQMRTGFRRLGAALGRLHSLPASHLPRFSRLDPPRLAQAARLIGRVRPDVAQAAERVADLLAESWQPPSDAPVPLHGDVNSRNWLLHENRVALIDLDQVSLGAAAADLGGALAGLRYRRGVGLLSAESEGTLRRALLRGYASTRRLPSPAGLRWHAAAALLVERALRAVTRFRQEGLLHLDRLVAEAEAMLTEAPDA